MTTELLNDMMKLQISSCWTGPSSVHWRLSSLSIWHFYVLTMIVTFCVTLHWHNSIWYYHISKLSPGPSFNSSWGMGWLYFRLLQANRLASRLSRIVFSKHNTALMPKVKLFNLISRDQKWFVTLTLSAMRPSDPLLPLFSSVVWIQGS